MIEAVDLHPRPLVVDLPTCREILGGISRASIFRLMRDEGFPYLKIRARLVFPVAAVERWVAEHTVNQPGEAA